MLYIFLYIVRGGICYNFAACFFSISVLVKSIKCLSALSLYLRTDSLAHLLLQLFKLAMNYTTAVMILCCQLKKHRDQVFMARFVFIVNLCRNISNGQKYHQANIAVLSNLICEPEQKLSLSTSLKVIEIMYF